MANDAQSDMFSPCRCKGTLQFVHQKCLRSWLVTGNFATKKKCPSCHAPYRLQVKGTHRSECFTALIWLISILLVIFINTLFTLLFVYYLRCVRSHGRSSWNPDVLFFFPKWLINEVDAQDMLLQPSGNCLRAGPWSLRGAFVYGTAKLAHQVAAVILCHRGFNLVADLLDALRVTFSDAYPTVGDISPALIQNVALVSVVGCAFKLWRMFALAEMPQYVHRLPVWLVLILLGFWFEFQAVLRISRSTMFWTFPSLKKWLLGDLEILPHNGEDLVSKID